MIKLAKLSFFLFIFLTFEANADSGLKIYNWKENIDLNSDGKSTQTTISAVANIPPNQGMSAFSIAFQSDQTIRMKEVKVDNKPAKFSFVNNLLKINFENPKINNERATLYFSYQEVYKKVNKYLRVEEIYIPAFAENANAQVTFNVPDFLESVTFNPNITATANGYVYNNIVRKNGVREMIKLTPSSGTWDVDLKIKIYSDQNLGKISLTLPQYFQDPLQRVENYLIAPNVTPTKQNIAKNGVNLDFDIPTNQMYISSRAKIFTGAGNRSKINRNPQNYINFSAEEAFILTPILEKIKENPKYKNYPLYAKIGEFVHDYITYDDSYEGKLPEIKEILSSQRGVCTEYAKLFSGLARVAGIPTATLYGGACGSDDKCEGHSWNLIYYNNQWIQVDPTWNLMSGTVSSSHIYLVENKLQGVEVNFEYEQGQQPQEIQSSFEFNMKDLK